MFCSFPISKVLKVFFVENLCFLRKCFCNEWILVDMVVWELKIFPSSFKNRICRPLKSNHFDVGCVALVCLEFSFQFPFECMVSKTKCVWAQCMASIRQSCIKLISLQPRHRSWVSHGFPAITWLRLGLPAGCLCEAM